MNSYRLYKNCIFALICCLYSIASYSAQWATVSSKKAIIYSDVEMKSSIGYIKRGKKIRVGSKPKNKGRVLPLILNKKILYIEIKDIQTNKKLANLKSATQRVRKQSQVIESEGRVALSSGVYISSTSSPEIDGVSDDIFLGTGVYGYYKNLVSNKMYRSGLTYHTLSEKRNSTNFSFSFLGVPIDYYFPIINTGVYDLHFYIGAIVAPFVEYKVGTDFTLNGYGLGGSAGADMVFKVTRNWGFHLEGAYQYLYTTGFEFPQVDDYPEEASFILSGFKVVGSLSYKY